MEEASEMEMAEDTTAPSSPEEEFELEEITTGPLTLTRSYLDDLKEFSADDDEVIRCCTWDPQPSIDQAIACMNDEAIPRPFFQAICANHDVLIGLISVTPNSGIHDKCRAELGYWLEKEYLGLGIVTTVLKIVVSTIFQRRPEWERLDAKVEVYDRASQKTLERVGFQREGVLRKYRRLNGRTVDVAMYSLLPSDLQLDSSL